MSASKKQHQVLISTDGHCGAALWDYKPYLERRYHDEFDTWASGYRDGWMETERNRPEHRRAGIASADSRLNWDSQLRLEHLDSQGVAAEVLFPNTAPPFYTSGALTAPAPRDRQEYELRFAGLRAHNRWLADFVSNAPERWAGFAQIFLNDVDDAVAEVRWAKEAGLRGVLLPSDHVLRMNNLYYPEYDALWAVCAEVGLPVHRHAPFPTESMSEGGQAAPLVGLFEIEFYAKRGIAHMILAGVFERHPDLVFVTTELTNGSDVPTYLVKLDALKEARLGLDKSLYEQTRDAVAQLRRRPSEYFATNCYIANPVMDLRLSYEAGTPNLMWGADIPHAEGTSPYTVEAIRALLYDLPEDDLKALVATRAAKVYNFDLDALQAIADRVGPTIGELTTPLPPDGRPRYPQDTRCRAFDDSAARQEQLIRA